MGYYLSWLERLAGSEEVMSSSLIYSTIESYAGHIRPAYFLPFLPTNPSSAGL